MEFLLVQYFVAKDCGSKNIEYRGVSVRRVELFPTRIIFKSAEPPQEQRPRRKVTKKEEDSHLPLFRTQSRGRTGTGVNLLVFETSASTDSAIWASADALSSGSAVQR